VRCIQKPTTGNCRDTCGDFNTANFSTRQLLKNIRLFLDDAKAAGLNTDVLEDIERITDKTVENGIDHMDYSSTYEVTCPD